MKVYLERRQRAVDVVAVGTSHRVADGSGVAVVRTFQTAGVSARSSVRELPAVVTFSNLITCFPPPRSFQLNRNRGSKVCIDHWGGSSVSVSHGKSHAQLTFGDLERTDM
jgi:hypothetical protein